MGEGHSSRLGARSTAVADSSRTSIDIADVAGSDWSGVLPTYQRIYQAALSDGYRAVLLTEDNVVGIYRGETICQRVKLDAHALTPGAWEEYVARLFLQIRLLEELQPFGDYVMTRNLSGEVRLPYGATVALETKVAQLLNVQKKVPLSMSVRAYPGAVQFLVSLYHHLIISVVFNPLHKFLLEFRFDPLPLVPIQELKSVTHVHRDRAELGFLTLATSERTKVLIVLDNAYQFGSPLRRLVLRTMPQLAGVGFQSLVTEVPARDESYLQQALADEQPLRYFMRRGWVSPQVLNPEWTALLSSATSLGLRVCGGLRDDPPSSNPLWTSADTARALVWFNQTSTHEALRWISYLRRILSGNEVAVLIAVPSEKGEHDPYIEPYSSWCLAGGTPVPDIPPDIPNAFAYVSSKQQISQESLT